jgi:chlorobactene glucosyltransferase
MQSALITLGAISFFEILLGIPAIWRFRKSIAQALMLGLLLSSLWLLASHLTSWSLLIVILSLYRAISLARILANRIHENYLFHAVQGTTLWLVSIQALVLASAWSINHWDIRSLTLFYYVTITQLAASLIILATTIRHLRTTKPPIVGGGYADRDLPSVTVAIPARNETDELEACLESLVLSTYPKLEILVLDDCSQNKRTPEIIRQFAQAGVRFMAGKMPPEHWLAKNYAYQQLAQEANGEVILFCGVDTRFEAGSISALVKIMLTKQKSMISLMPKNRLIGFLRPLLVQPGRYAWEMALPRKLVKRPPVLSTCWLITKGALESAGGFAATKRKAVPESYLAGYIAKQSDGYSFMQADEQVAITSQKDFEEQRATATRNRYPQLHRRPELIALVGLAELALLVWPLIIAVVAALTSHWQLSLLAGSATLANFAVFNSMVNLVYRRQLFSGTWFLPFAALYDIGLLNLSMWQYEFGEVLWKGRNVCLPVMRVIPHLPKV